MTDAPAKASPLAEPVTVLKMWKNRRRSESVHVTLSEYEGHALVSVRLYATGTDGCDRPTPKGVSISVRKLPELAAGLARALDKARDMGLLDLAEPAE
jgi:hypothetical protein